MLRSKDSEFREGCWFRSMQGTPSPAPAEIIFMRDHLHEGFLLGPGFDGDSRAARRADQEEVSHEEANASRSRNETPTSM